MVNYPSNLKRFRSMDTNFHFLFMPNYRKLLINFNLQAIRTAAM